MTDKELCERLRGQTLTVSDSFNTRQEAADRIEALSAEVERLREAFLETREMLGLAEQAVHEGWCPTKWKTADGQPHCKLHEDIQAVLFKYEAMRDAARAALAGDKP